MSAEIKMGELTSAIINNIPNLTSTLNKFNNKFSIDLKSQELLEEYNKQQEIANYLKLIELSSKAPDLLTKEEKFAILGLAKSKVMEQVKEEENKNKSIFDCFFSKCK